MFLQIGHALFSGNMLHGIRFHFWVLISLSQWDYRELEGGCDTHGRKWKGEVKTWWRWRWRPFNGLARISLKVPRSIWKNFWNPSLSPSSITKLWQALCLTFPLWRRMSFPSSPHCYQGYCNSSTGSYCVKLFATLISVRSGGKLNTGIPGESLGNLLCWGTCFSNTIHVYGGPCFWNMSRNKFLRICCATCCTTYSYVYGWLNKCNFCFCTPPSNGQMGIWFNITCTPLGSNGFQDVLHFLGGGVKETF